MSSVKTRKDFLTWIGKNGKNHKLEFPFDEAYILRIVNTYNSKKKFESLEEMFNDDLGEH